MPNARKSLCFVLMPFNEAFDAIYETIIKPTVEQTQNLACQRADDLYASRPIMADVWELIQIADVLIADLTNKNPNVLYELGLAHAIQKPVILITQNETDVPFDLRSVRYIRYSQNRKEKLLLQTKLSAAIDEFMKDKAEDKSYINRYTILRSLVEKNESRKLTDFYAKINILDQLTNQEKKETLASGIKLNAIADRNMIAPEAIREIIKLLDTDFDDLKLLCLEAIKAFHVRTAIPKVRMLISDTNADIQLASINIIRDFRDYESIETIISAVPRAKSEAIKNGLADALSSVADRAVLKRMTDALNERPPSFDPIVAAHVLLNQDNYECEKSLLESTFVKDNEELAIKVCRGLADEDRFFSLGLKQKIKQFLEYLLASSNVGVRIDALVAWHVRELDRGLFWSVMERQDESFLLEFFGYGALELSFAIADQAKLVNLAKRFPTLSSTIIWKLADKPHPGTASFMKSQIESSPDEALWLYRYFAQCPSDIVLKECEDTVKYGEDINIKFLAAICLHKLSCDFGSKFIAEHKENKDLYPWVKELLDEATT